MLEEQRVKKMQSFHLVLKFDAAIMGKTAEDQHKEIADRLRKTADHIESTPGDVINGAAIEDDEVVVIWRLGD